VSAAPRDAIVLRFGEIFLKGGNRSFFEARLLEGVRRAVAGLASARIDKVHARVIVEIDAADRGRAVARLARVFGVQSLSPARICPPDLALLESEAVRAASEAAAARGGKPSFKVDCRRSDKSFPARSDDVNRDVGARIVRELGLPVDVHRPEMVVGIEIGPQRSFVYADTLPGPGGLPVGSTGLVNLLISGGIDSPVAGWLAMKRGCTLVATYFHSFPYTGDKTREKVTELVRLLADWHGPIPLHVVHFTAPQKALRDAGPGELAVVLYRRMMMRVATLIARRAGAAALCTGENLAQVASQTLGNLAVIERAAGLPVLRPLLCYDKLETVALARRIGTYETSIQPYDDCCSLFVPAHPSTHARLDAVEDAEARLDVDALAREMADSAEVVLAD
jgi:thiamine biosynthesis protein ThiI